MPEFKDYDEAVGEYEGESYKFRFGGEDFEVDLNIDGAVMLEWMRNSSSTASMEKVLKHVLGDDYPRLIATGAKWPKYQALISDIFTHIGGLGNA